jgi:hypothetical protein
VLGAVWNFRTLGEVRNSDWVLRGDRGGMSQCRYQEERYYLHQSVYHHRIVIGVERLLVGNLIACSVTLDGLVADHIASC